MQSKVTKPVNVFSALYMSPLSLKRSDTVRV